MPRRRAGVIEEPGRLPKTGWVSVALKPSTERLLKGPLRRRQKTPNRAGAVEATAVVQHSGRQER